MSVTSRQPLPTRQAIVDIGSNSIRLVVFGGAPRAPVVLYNEKIMAGLGNGVVGTGTLDPATVATALAGLARFAALLGRMELDSLQVVATAAVREAANGAEFIQAVRALGLPAELLDGDAEAVASGYGVIAGLPQADGIAADMGGGSLELVRVSGGEVGQRASFPLGSLRVAALRAKGPGKLREAVAAAVASLGWADEARGRGIYLVGGSWRTLARVHMHLSDFPLEVIGNYSYPASVARPLADTVQAMDEAQLKALPQVKGARVASLPHAAALLAALVEALEPDTVVTSAYGLREGLLFQNLPAAERAKDPLVESVRFVAAPQQQVAGYADALARWIAPVFPGEPPELARLRHCACLLRGTGWASSPDFRALGAEDLALHGNWTGAAPSDRAAIALALYVAMGGPGNGLAALPRLAPQALLRHARGWGQAIRLAQRIGGGAPGPLAASSLALSEGTLELRLPVDLAPLVDTAVQRRTKRLAEAVGANGYRILAPD